jgi:hypothetical protein
MQTLTFDQISEVSGGSACEGALVLAGSAVGFVGSLFADAATAGAAVVATGGFTAAGGAVGYLVAQAACD